MFQMLLFPKPVSSVFSASAKTLMYPKHTARESPFQDHCIQLLAIKKLFADTADGSRDVQDKTA